MSSFAKFITAIEADEHGNDGAAAWHERREHLEKLGGAPVE